MKKTVSFAAGALALISLSGAASYADSFQSSPSGSITMISKEETGIPGYFHQKYVFDHPDCLGAVPVDYYGPLVDANDPAVIARESKFCAQSFWGRDGGQDGGGGGDD
jgi:hypothetical protein